MKNLLKGSGMKGKGLDFEKTKAAKYKIMQAKSQMLRSDGARLELQLPQGSKAHSPLLCYKFPIL